jgi:hypothetical protein
MEAPVCDNKLHLICEPYSVEGLHRVAERLGIKRCWFHKTPGKAHYDIPKTRIAEVTAQCRVVTSRELLGLITASHAQ